jgi:RNA recognition motif-containing protein
MGKKVYVGNLGSAVTGSDLNTLFAAHGTVQSARVLMNRETGLSKGFGLVEMGTVQEAKAAIAALNGQDSDGRPLKVKVARLKPESRRRPGAQETGG